ncbi:hypothetical protein [Solwaraspora sp. WMMA2101]|uniref:hypothetical protein n=1 Tax=Solwaraspora sp. WMMA2101 TaxID=3404124 RepID=UPI003B95CE6B
MGGPTRSTGPTRSFQAAALFAVGALLLVTGCGGDPTDEAAPVTAASEASDGADPSAAAVTSPSADPEPVSFTEGGGAAARDTVAPGAIVVQTLTEEEFVLYSVGDDGTVTENWRFTPKVYADNPVQDVASSQLRREDFTPDYRQLVVIRKEAAEPIGFTTRVGLLAIDGTFTDLSGYGATDPDKAVQSHPAVHHATARLWYWQYQDRQRRLMSVGLDGQDRRHEAATQEKLPRTVVGQPFYFPDSAVAVPTYDDGKVMVVDDTGTVGAKYVLAGAGAQIGDPYQISDAPRFASPGYTLVSWVDEQTLLAYAQDQVYALTIAGSALTEQALITDSDGPRRPAIRQAALSPDATQVLLASGVVDDLDVTQFSLLPIDGGEPAPLAQVAPGAGRVGDQIIGWQP